MKQNQLCVLSRLLIGVLLIGGSMGSRSGRAENLEGTAYEPKTNHSKELFHFRCEDTIKDKLRTIHSYFTGLDGKELVSEEVTVTDGKLTRYLVHHKQTGEEGSLDVKDGKLLFSYTRKGSTDTNEEKAPDNLIIGPLIVGYIQSHWDEILKGDAVPVRFAVLDRKETVGFKLEKESEFERNGKKVIQVKMKPTSIFIAAIVDPIHFILSKDNKEILEIDGRTLPKREDKGSFKDLDPEILYHGVPASKG